MQTLRNVRIDRPLRPSRDVQRRGLLRAFLATILLAGLCLVSRPASAAGTVSVTSLAPTENDGRWKLNMTINYGGVPHIGHIPMIFTFTAKVLYERALTDQTGDRPILNRIPLQNQQPINESMDVGFANAEGKVFAITKFDFVIRRDRGFEAGEYDLKITRTDDGVQMGQILKLKLMGDNPIVDRRAITFAGEKKKEKKPDTEAAKTGEEGEKKADAPASGEEPAAEPGASTDVEGAAAPPPVEPKQGGCGCRVASQTEDMQGLAALALGAGLVARRFRRRPRSSSISA